MKKTAITSVLTAAALFVFMAGSAMAAGMSSSAGTVPSAKADSKLNAEIMMLNNDAKLPQADAVIMKQLADNFSVSQDKITSLMHKNLQYGEVAAVLALAEKMPGGITDANINKVMTLHQTKTGWSDVAKGLNVDMSGIASKLGSIEDHTHSGIKQALAESSAVGTGAGGLGTSEPGAATGGTGTYGEGVTGGGTGGTENLPEGNEGGISGSGTGGVDSGTTGSGTGGTDSGIEGSHSGVPESPTGGGY